LEAKIKINLKLFSALGQNLKYPFFVLDRLGRILFSNESAEDFLGFQKKREKIFLYFEEHSSEKFNKLFDEHLKTSTSQTKLLDLQLTNGKELKSKITFTSYTEKKEVLIFCTFKSIELSIKSKEITGVYVKSDDFKNFINNKQLLNIIDELKSLYPFTFIGKEKFRKEVDKLSELFWIKDYAGNFDLVNKKFSEKLGVNSTILEGKKYNDFVAAHLANFYKSIDNYIKDSLNCIIIEGTPVNSLLHFQKYQTIQIPLSDVDNNVIAVICITQKIKEKELKITGTEFFNLNSKLLDEYPKPIGLFDNNSILKQKSEHFSKLFLRKFTSRKKIEFSEIFSFEITDKINSFLQSPLESEKNILTFNTKDDSENRKTFEIILHKLKFDKSKVNGFIFEANPVVNKDDFEGLLKRRGEMFDILIQNNPEPIFIYEKDNLKFLEVNEAAIELYGFRKDEFLQMDLTDLYTPDDIQTLLGSSTENRLKSTQFNGPYRHRIKDGSTIFVEISKIAFMYQGREAHFNIIKDVTKKLILDIENQEYKAVFDNTTNLLFTTDQTGFIKYANDKALSLVKTTDKKIVGESFISLFIDDDRSKINNKIFKSKSLNPVNLKAKLRKNGNETVQVEITATPIFNFEGNIDTFTIVGILKQDVVKQIVQDKIATSLKKENQKIDPLFLSSLFHEILTPINVILGFVQDLTGNLNELTPEQNETKDIIDQNRERLLDTMNSVVDYTNILNNDIRLNITKVGIPEVIDYIQKKNNTVEDSQKKEFTYGKISSSLSFETDTQRYQTLMFLLFKIISKLSDQDKLYFSAVTFGDDKFLVSFKDSYASLSEELYKKIVDLFSNEGKSSTDVFGLSVLTMLLTKALLKLLKGKFHKDETDNKNCGFIFPLEFKVDEIQQNDKPTKIKSEKTLTEKHEEKTTINKEESSILDKEGTSIVTKKEETPIIEDKEVTPITSEGSIQKSEITENGTKEEALLHELDLGELSCLYIEDQVDSQILFKVQLKGLKEIKYAVSFEEALPLLDSEIFDFIVMDINLQGEYNGLDALKIIKKMPGYENTPIIAVTAYVLPGDREKFIATGFEDFISKPIFREKMLRTLERIFIHNT